MSAQADFAAYCAELFAPLGEVRTRRMFGGYGVYVGDVFVAIIVQDVLYLKADEQTRPQFEAAGGRRFEYTRQGRQQGAGFWTVPPDAMDSPARMQPWARLAQAAAVRARVAAPQRRTPKNMGAGERRR